MSLLNFDPKELLEQALLNEGLKNRNAEQSISDIETIVQRVTSFYIAMKSEQNNIEGPYKVSGEWLKYIGERSSIYNAFRKNDISLSTAYLSNFWRNDLGLIVKEYANFEQLTGGSKQHIERFKTNVLRNYLIWKYLFESDDAQLEVSSVGNSWGIQLNNQLIVPKATRFLTHSNRICELLRDRSKPVMLEIGGGYGGLAFYLLRDNPKLQYLNVDIPETLVLAAFYLLSSFPNKKFYLYGEGNPPYNSSEIDALLLPNFKLPEIPNNSIDLVYNSFSLSELGIETLKEYLIQIARITRQYFYHNNMDRPGVVNRGSERIPASKYPISSSKFKCLNAGFDLFHGHNGDYREYLYECLDA